MMPGSKASFHGKLACRGTRLFVSFKTKKLLNDLLRNYCTVHDLPYTRKLRISVFKHGFFQEFL